MSSNKSPLDMLGDKLAKKREELTQRNIRKNKKEETVAVRANKSQVKEIKRLILDFEEYKNVTDFVIKALEEKLAKERKKAKK